jgi:WD40 repeat protein
LRKSKHTARANGIRGYGHTHDVNNVVISPDGQTIFSCSVDTTIRLWSLSQRKEIYTLQGHSRGVNSIAIHSNGQILASGSYDETIKLWDVQTRQELFTITAHTGGVHAIAIEISLNFATKALWVFLILKVKTAITFLQEFQHSLLIISKIESAKFLSV